MINKPNSSWYNWLIISTLFPCFASKLPTATNVIILIAGCWSFPLILSRRCLTISRYIILFCRADPLLPWAVSGIHVYLHTWHTCHHLVRNASNRFYGLPLLSFGTLLAGGVACHHPSLAQEVSQNYIKIRAWTHTCTNACSWTLVQLAGSVPLQSLACHYRPWAVGWPSQGLHSTMCWTATSTNSHCLDTCPLFFFKVVNSH